jgi:hypothetical protein
MTCQRRYYYEHVLCWQPDYPNIHLEFGIAWHLAKEFLLQDGSYTESAAHEAFQKFQSHYRKFYDIATDSDRAPKNAAFAYEALLSYCEKYGRQNKQFKVLHTEVAGMVSLETNNLTANLCYRIDAVVQEDTGNIRVLDHKTASVESQAFIDSWQLSVQMGAYIYAVTCFYPPEQVKGAFVDVTYFRKKGMGTECHSRIPVQRGENSLQVWHWNVLQDVKKLSNEISILENEPIDKPVMECFPMNTENCTKYGRCPYMDFCVAWPNPMKKADSIPMGFRKKEWNPLEMQSGAKEIWKKEN